MSKKQKRANIKLDLTNRDILRFAKRVTGKDYNEFLREILNSWILCASAYAEFTYTVNVHSPESIEIRFFGKPALISKSMKVTSEYDVAEAERGMIADVEKSMSFSNVANRMTKAKRATIRKVVD